MKPFQRPEFTMFNNYILDRIMPKLAPNAWKILCVAIRQTVGWEDSTTESGRKESDIISYSQFRNRSGIKSNSTVAGAINECVDKGYLFQTRIGEQELAYGLNMDYEAPDKDTFTDSVKDTEDTFTESVKVSFTDSVNTKEKEKKEERKLDIFDLAFRTQRAQQREGNWAETTGAKSNDTFIDKPVNAFAEICAKIDPDKLPLTKRKKWAKKLQEIAIDWSTKDRIMHSEDMVTAIRRIPNSPIHWKIYNTPFMDSFAEDIGPLLLGPLSSNAIKPKVIKLRV